MKKTVLMIHPKHHAKLIKLAAKENVSIAEIYRRAIDAYDPVSTREQQELELLAEVVKQSCIQTSHAIDEARQEIEETLNYFHNKRESQKRNSNEL